MKQLFSLEFSLKRCLQFGKVILLYALLYFIANLVLVGTFASPYVDSLNYSVVGKAVGAAIENASNSAIFDVYSPSGPTPSTNTIPINWNLDGSLYSGAFRVISRTAFDNVLLTFYEGFCMTRPVAKCGDRLNHAERDPNFKPSTGTSVDQWYTLASLKPYTFNPETDGRAYAWNASNSTMDTQFANDANTNRSAVSDYEFQCASGSGRRIKYAAARYTNTNPYGGAIYSRYLIWKQTITAAGVAPTYNLASNADFGGALNWIVTDSTTACAKPSLLDWQGGTYWTRAIDGTTPAEPVQHFDVPDGARIILYEIQAERDRVNPYFTFISPLGFSPEPSPVQIGTNPTPSSPTPTTPTTPPDTQTNCNFIDIPCNLRALFIPRKDFIQTKMQTSMSLTLPNFQVNLVDSLDIGPIDIPLPSGNISTKIPLDFTFVDKIPQTAKDIFYFLSFWGVLFVVIKFFNIPILGNKGGG